jgi:hypothetical protein
MNKRTASNFVHGLNLIKVYLVEEPLSRLLARVLKEDVQWYNETSTVKEGRGGRGSRRCFSGKPLKILLLHVSISCSKLVRNVSNKLASLCRYMLLYLTTV